ncbi:DUF4160 domain-containing protein [candidate division KSB1 bacterium]|nr:DUF4160 domain-containing protein [candidate division KSB1 bacterium]
MPTVLRIGAYRFFFYSGDKQEPPHIHVERESYTCKFWLNPVVYCKSQGFNRHEINQIHKMVEEYKNDLLRKWHEYFD